MGWVHPNCPLRAVLLTSPKLSLQELFWGVLHKSALRFNSKAVRDQPNNSTGFLTLQCSSKDVVLVSRALLVTMHLCEYIEIFTFLPAMLLVSFKELHYLHKCFPFFFSFIHCGLSKCFHLALFKLFFFCLIKVFY